MRVVGAGNCVDNRCAYRSTMVRHHLIHVTGERPNRVTLLTLPVGRGEVGRWEYTADDLDAKGGGIARTVGNLCTVY